MVTTVTLPDDLHARLKTVAAEEHRSMHATILVAIEAYLARNEHRARVRDLAGQVASQDAELLDRLAR